MNKENQALLDKGKRNMQEFLEAIKKNSNKLFEELQAKRFSLHLDFFVWDTMALKNTLKQTDRNNRILKGKPKTERINYFVDQAYHFCQAIEQGDENAEEIRKELDYFKHCFLKDSQYSNIPTEYSALKSILFRPCFN